MVPEGRGSREDGAGAHREAVRAAFEKQAEEFSRSPVMTDSGALERLVACSRLTDEARVLDVACGPGIVAAALAPHVRTVVGIDLTPAMIDRGMEIVAAQVAHNVIFILGDVTHLPFSDASFDRVISRRSFHHFPDPAAVLSEMARACVPGGGLIIEDQALPADPVAAETMTTVDRLRDPSHTRAVAPDAWRDLFAACGLRFEGIDIVPREMDFDEWMNRVHPAPGDAAQARDILEAVARGERSGPRAWRAGDALRFVFDLQIIRGAKP